MSATAALPWTKAKVQKALRVYPLAVAAIAALLFGLGFLMLALLVIVGVRP